MDSLFDQATKRQLERPDIHFHIALKKGNREERSFNFTLIEGMVEDLLSHFPELGRNQLSDLIGVSRETMSRVLDNSQEREFWTEEDNPASSAAELTALTLHHPDRQYEDHPDAETECSAVPFLFTAPQPRDYHHRADQSHTVKRPITLPAFPFLPLPERCAA